MDVQTFTCHVICLLCIKAVCVGALENIGVDLRNQTQELLLDNDKVDSVKNNSRTQQTSATDVQQLLSNDIINGSEYYRRNLSDIPVLDDDDVGESAVTMGTDNSDVDTEHASSISIGSKAVVHNLAVTTPKMLDHSSKFTGNQTPAHVPSHRSTSVPAYDITKSTALTSDTADEEETVRLTPPVPRIHGHYVMPTPTVAVEPCPSGCRCTAPSSAKRRHYWHRMMTEYRRRKMIYGYRPDGSGYKSNVIRRGGGGGGGGDRGREMICVGLNDIPDYVPKGKWQYLYEDAPIYSLKDIHFRPRLKTLRGNIFAV